MSMFYELMMRKKQQIMYATIKGSLTENDGVFSGFSASNYLEIPNVPTYTQDDRIEVVVNFNLSSIVDDNVLFGGEGSFIVPLASTEGKIKYYSSISGFSGRLGLNVLATNQNYYFKAIYDSGSFNAYISTDGINWILDYSANISATFSKSGAFLFGRNLASSYQYLRGSIDLNNSYIKLGSTKYNLQAVVGYTVVGSPTITDGVVSGFSSGNYLTLPSIPENSYNRIEIRTKITTGATIEAGNIIGDNSYYCNGLLIGSTGKLSSQFNFSNYDRATSDVVIEANTEYTIKTIVDINAKSLMIDVNGTINTHTLQYYTDIKAIPYRFGYGYRNGTFNGSINVGATEIYIDNKLWFNGQSAQ